MKVFVVLVSKVFTLLKLKLYSKMMDKLVNVYIM